jgi:hypothetical protein
MHGFGWHDHGFAAGQHGRARCGVGIAGAQVLGVIVRLALQERLGSGGGEPASIFGDADEDDFIFFFIDCVDHGGGREQGHFVLPAASAEQDSHAQFFHDISVWTGEAGAVNRDDGSAC